MIDTIVNMLFRCSHRRLTRPITSVSRPGSADILSYVACLDCGKRFAYDAKEMRVGRALAVMDSNLDPHDPVGRI